MRWVGEGWQRLHGPAGTKRISPAPVLQPNHKPTAHPSCPEPPNCKNNRDYVSGHVWWQLSHLSFPMKNSLCNFFGKPLGFLWGWVLDWSSLALVAHPHSGAEPSWTQGSTEPSHQLHRNSAA